MDTGSSECTEKLNFESNQKILQTDSSVSVGVQDIKELANTPALSKTSNSDFEKHFLNFVSTSLNADTDGKCISQIESQKCVNTQESAKLKTIEKDNVQEMNVNSGESKVVSDQSNTGEIKKKVAMETKSVSSNLDLFPWQQV